MPRAAVPRQPARVDKNESNLASVIIHGWLLLLHACGEGSIR